MAGALELGFPALRYDITMPLLDGRVSVPGVTLKPARGTSMVFKDVPELREGRFGVADLNLGYLLPAIENGWKLRAIPVFAKRKGPLCCIFTRTKAGIKTPKDLENKRVGTRQWRTALTLWARGILAEHYGVDVPRIRWIAQIPEVFPLHAAPDVTYVDPEPGIIERFLAGEVDAVMTDISDAAVFDRLENAPGVRRLFPDYAGEEARLIGALGFFTPVHVIVISAVLADQRPDLAPALYDAFLRAKAVAEADLLSDRAGFAIAWLREAAKAERARFGDLWPYGVAANRAAIAALMRYNAADGAIGTEMPLEAVFAKGTVET